MKILPSGKFALSITHPGHELRLHGFIEQTKPFIFVLADQGQPSRMARMGHYLGFIFKNTKKDKRDAFYVFEKTASEKDPNPIKNNMPLYLKDEEICTDLLKQSTAFFEVYVKQMANRLVQNKIDYLVVDASEDLDYIHDICRVMTEAACQLVKKHKGKKIKMYEYNVMRPFNYNISEDCICVALTQQQQIDKLKYILNYHPDIFTELRQNLSVDINVLARISEQQNGFEEIKNMLFAVNKDFFCFEYLRPASDIEHDDEYKQFILPLREKLMKL